MPVLFAPPNQNSYYSSSSRSSGGGNVADSAMADIAAYRAQNAAAEFNAQAQQQANIAGAQMQAHAAMQERAAELEIQGWMQKQAFTQTDQQELVRQQNTLSELQTKLDNGDISQPEFYKMLQQVAPRVNYLAFKEQHTKNQALEQQRQEHAALFQARKEQLDSLNALQSSELEGRMDTYIPDDQKSTMAEHMQLVHPELQPGTPEYDAKMKLEAAEMGVGTKMVKMPGGKLVSLDSLLVKAGMKSSSPTTQAGGTPTGEPTPAGYKSEGEMFDKAYARALKMLTTKDEHGHDQKPAPAEVQAMAEKMMRDEMTFHEQRRQEREAKTPQGQIRTTIDTTDKNIEAVKGRDDLSLSQKAAIVQDLAAAKEILARAARTPSGKLTAAATRRLAAINNKVRIISSMSAAPPTGQFPGPQNVAQQTGGQ